MKGVIDMAKSTTSISIDTDVKEKALPILNELGLDLSTTVGMLLRQVIREPVSYTHLTLPTTERV